MLKICLARQGKNRKPSYRIVVLEKGAAPERTFIELLGHYQPRSKEKTLKLNKERTELWIKRGAVPSAAVQILLKR
ncbi:MAG: 30S ribosomal protein S16 [Parcubacteria group bacterium]|nr:30S ribosomal protein S16 [Parcubacteria group bacterium]